MSGLEFRFGNWRKFEAYEDKTVIRKFLSETGKESEKVFKAGMRAGKSGKAYYGRSRRTIIASAVGEYPAIDTGELMASIKTVTTADTVTIGTNKFYAHFLRYGTSRMRRRKMSDNALSEGLVKTRKLLMGFIKWR